MSKKNSPELGDDNCCTAFVAMETPSHSLFPFCRLGKPVVSRYEQLDCIPQEGEYCRAGNRAKCVNDSEGLLPYVKYEDFSKIIKR